MQSARVVAAVAELGSLGVIDMKAVCRFLTAVFLSFSIVANAAGNQEVGPFVQQFYDWYIASAVNGQHKDPACEVALKKKPEVFGAELAHALRADIEAQSKSPHDLVGLDSDPFLNSQDPCEKYEVGAIAKNGATYSVEVFPVCEGQRSKKSRVVAVVAQVNGLWRFVNFKYSDQPGDLLQRLRLLKKERESWRTK